jgi:hypothetical protein
MLDFKAKKLNRALEGDKSGIDEDIEELLDIGKKLSQTRLVDSKNIEIDAFFAETLKEKLYYDWADNQESGRPKKKTVLRYLSGFAFGAAVIVLAVFLTYRFFTPYTENQQIAEPTPNVPTTENPAGPTLLEATLAYTQGTVEVWRDNGWVAAEHGLVIGSDQQIRTGALSKAVINFEEGSVMRLDHDSHIIIEEMNGENITLQQIIGKSYNRVNKSSTAAYSVRSLNTQATALGTAFTVEILEQDPLSRVKLRVLESSIKLEIFDNNERTADIVGQGEQALVNSGRPITESAKVETINKEGLMDEFVAWNREQDIAAKQPLGVLEDIEPPILTITNPLNGLTTREEKVTILGQTETSSEIKINGNPAEKQGGNFEQMVLLNEGENLFTIESFDRAGNIARAVIKITRLAVVAEEVNQPEPAASQETPSEREDATAGPSEPAKKPTVEAPKTNTENFVLNGTPNDKGVYLSWTAKEADTNFGFMIYKDDKPNIDQASAEYYLFPYSYGRHYFWPVAASGSHYFKICIRAKDGSISSCSNEIKAEFP